MSKRFDPQSGLIPDRSDDHVQVSCSPLPTLRDDSGPAPSGPDHPHPMNRKKIISTLVLAVMAGGGISGWWWARQQADGPMPAMAGASELLLKSSFEDSPLAGEPKMPEKQVVVQAAAERGHQGEVTLSVGASFERGRALLAMGQPEQAMPFLQAAVEADSDNAEARYRLGLAAYQAGDVATLREQAIALRTINRSYASMLSNLR